jgi:hypothetical protein
MKFVTVASKDIDTILFISGINLDSRLVFLGLAALGATFALALTLSSCSVNG